MISCVLLGLATKTCGVAPQICAELHRCTYAARPQPKVSEHDLALQSISKGS